MYILLKEFGIKPHEIEQMPYEYIQDIFTIRGYEIDREKRERRKGSRTQEAEDNVRRMVSGE